jgi:hypothetical protein
MDLAFPTQNVFITIQIKSMQYPRRGLFYTHDPVCSHLIPFCAESYNFLTSQGSYFVKKQVYEKNHSFIVTSGSSLH